MNSCDFLLLPYLINAHHSVVIDHLLLWPILLLMNSLHVFLHFSLFITINVTNWTFSFLFSSEEQIIEEGSERKLRCKIWGFFYLHPNIITCFLPSNLNEIYSSFIYLNYKKWDNCYLEMQLEICIDDNEDGIFSLPQIAIQRTWREKMYII